jgi:hypothetical protein
MNAPAAPPITAPIHTWFTSPARSHPDAAQAKELPLHLIQLILSHLDDAADLARITRTSRLFYYMTLPRLYERVTLHCYAEVRYNDEGKPEGYGSGSPFAMGLNTLVARNFTDYVQAFRLVGDWREHDVDDYTKGRVPDNSMVLQIAMRAALDKMKNLQAFAYVSQKGSSQPTHLPTYLLVPEEMTPLTRVAGSSTPSPSAPSTRASSTAPRR